jgi:hypothetical protein
MKTSSVRTGIIDTRYKYYNKDIKWGKYDFKPMAKKPVIQITSMEYNLQHLTACKLINKKTGKLIGWVVDIHSAFGLFNLKGERVAYLSDRNTLEYGFTFISKNHIQVYPETIRRKIHSSWLERKLFHPAKYEYALKWEEDAVLYKNTERLLVFNYVNKRKSVLTEIFVG